MMVISFTLNQIKNGRVLVMETYLVTILGFRSYFSIKYMLLYLLEVPSRGAPRHF